MRIQILTMATALGLITPVTAQTIVVVQKDVSTVGLYGADGRELAVHATGTGPHEVAVSRNGRWAVVTDYGAAGPGGSTLTVIDMNTRQLAGTITLPYVRPHGILFLPDDSTVAVTAERDGMVTLVSIPSGRIIAEHSTGQRASHMVALSPGADTIYTANIVDGTLSIIPRSGGDAVTVRVGTQTEAIAAMPDGSEVWLGSNNTGKVFMVDPAARRVVDSVQTNGWPYRIAFTPDSRVALVTNPESGEVRLLDARTRATLKMVSTGEGSQPFGIAVAPNGSRAWITLRGDSEVIEVSIPDGRIVNRFSTGQSSGPDGIGVIP